MKKVNPRKKTNPKNEEKRLQAGSKTDKKFNEKEIQLVVEEIRTHYDGEIIDGWNYVHLAVKNQDTYMMMHGRKGLKVIQNGAKIFSGKLPGLCDGLSRGAGLRQPPRLLLLFSMQKAF